MYEPSECEGVPPMEFKGPVNQANMLGADIEKFKIFVIDKTNLSAFRDSTYHIT